MQTCPMPWARAVQAASMASVPWRSQTASQCRKARLRLSRASAGVGGAARAGFRCCAKAAALCSAWSGGGFQVHTAADGEPKGAARPASRLDQHAGDFSPRHHHVVGPLQGHQGRRHAFRGEVGHRQRRHEGDQRRLGRGFFQGQEQGGGKIAGAGLPGPTSPAPPGQLTRGGDPEGGLTRPASARRRASALVESIASKRSTGIGASGGKDRHTRPNALGRRPGPGIEQRQERHHHREGEQTPPRRRWRGRTWRGRRSGRAPGRTTWS